MASASRNALQTLTQSAARSTDLAGLLDAAVTCGAQLLAVERCSVWDVLPDGSALVLRAGIGGSLSSAEPQSRPVRFLTAVRDVLAGTSSQHNPGVPQAFQRFSSPFLLPLSEGTISICVGVTPQTAPVCVLAVDVPCSRRLTDAELSDLQVVADVLAIGLDRLAVSEAERGDGLPTTATARVRSAEQAKAIMAERHRLARELHDSVTQSLYSVTLHAEAAFRQLAAGDHDAAGDNLRVLQTTAQETLDELRLLIFELRPPMLEQLGLAAALQARLNAVEGRANLDTQLIVDGSGTLPVRAEAALYRIAQEALNNALRHARARHITVQLRYLQVSVSLEVMDDGVGFEPAAAGAAGGYGLRGIAERVAQLDGTYTVDSAAGSGTRLRVEIAL